MLQEIPHKYKQFWVVDSTPPEYLVHITPLDNIFNIQATQLLYPKDPAPRDWEGLKAVYLLDLEDSTAGTRLKENLLQHFMEKSSNNGLAVVRVVPQDTIYRCTIKGRSSYRLSLSPTPILKTENAKKTLMELVAS